MRFFSFDKLKLQKIFYYAIPIIISITVLLILFTLDNEREQNDDAEPVLNFATASANEDIVYRTRASDGCESEGCHQGIEDINPKMNFQCTMCHEGNGDATDKETAHTDMYVNPGDLSIVDNTCGKCHGTLVSNVKKSLHSTSAGVISGARYTWGAQVRDSIYGNYDIIDEDGLVPEEQGALESLDQIPKFGDSNEPVDDYLRNQCLRCHLWTDGAKRAGDYRSSGCSACHVLYSDDGGYKGSNPSTNLSDPDNPLKHEITVKIPSEQCIHCHNRGGRTGVSFIGTMESDGYGTPYTETGENQPKLHGKYYNKLSPDVHYERGLECIDCHTLSDVMGDGNIYGKKEQAVEIECTDCHGTAKEFPWDSDGNILTSGAVKADGTKYGTSGGNKITNVEKRDDKLILTSKYSGEEHEVPVLKTLNDEDGWKSAMAKTAMSSVPHTETLECYACHAKWAPQCYGCHAKMDAGKTSYDWISGAAEANGWSESRSYLRWENPVLGINAEGKVSPFIPGCQVIFTYIDENGNAVTVNKVFETKDGTSGIATNPIQPHTTSAESRTCGECHSLRKSLGLGSGIYDPERNGLPVDFELERIVDEDGNQIQATSHEGARPFNKEELEKISKVGVCMGCHESYSDPIWDKVTDVTGFAESDEDHSAVMGLALSAIPSAQSVLVFIATDGHDGSVHLKWEFTNANLVDHYNIYWSKTLISDTDELAPGAEVTADSYMVEGLEVDQTYYFAIVAVDKEGQQSGVAFSNAKPTGNASSDLTGVEGEKKKEPMTLYDQFLFFMVAVLIILVLVALIMLAGGKSKKPQDKKGREEEREDD